MAVTQKINFLTLVSYSLLQTLFRLDIPFCHNTKRHRETTDDRQMTQCTKGSTKSMVGQQHKHITKSTLVVFGSIWLVNGMGLFNSCQNLDKFIMHQTKPKKPYLRVKSGVNKYTSFGMVTEG